MPTLNDLFAPSGSPNLNDLFNLPERTPAQRDAGYFQSRLQHHQQNGRGRLDNEVSDFLPFSSSVNSFLREHTYNAAVERIDAGNATNQDFEDAASFLAAQQRAGGESFLERVGNGIIRLPAFAAEIYLTGGAGSVGRSAGQRAASGLLRGAATSVAGRVASRGAGLATGLAAWTAANPQRVAATAAEMSRPDVSVGEEGVNVQRNGSVTSNLPAAFVDTMIEIGSEQAGEGLSIAGRALSQSRIFGPLVNSISQRWASSVLGRTLSFGDNSVARTARSLANQAGYHGVVGEMFEERVGEVLRGVTGLRDNYGTTGDIVSGRLEQAGVQLAEEFTTFAAIPIAFGAANRALGARGVTPQTAEQRLSSVTTALTTAYHEAAANGQPLSRDAAMRVLNDVAPRGPLRAYGMALIEALPTNVAFVTEPVGAPLDAPTSQASPDYQRWVAEARQAGLSEASAQQYAQQTQRMVEAEQAPAQQPIQPEPSVMPVEARVDSPMTPEQASQALAAEQSRINVEGRNAVSGTTQPASPQEAPQVAPVEAVPVGGQAEKARQLAALERTKKNKNLPQWMMTDAIRDTEVAINSGLADKIEQLASQQYTARNIAAKLGIEENNVVNIRLGLGIPGRTMPSSSVINPEFTAWLAAYQSRGQQGPPPTGQTPAEVAPEVAARQPAPKRTGSTKKRILDAVGQEPVIDLAELRQSMPKNMQGKVFDRTIIELAEQGHIIAFKDADASSFTPEQLSKLVKLGDNYFTTISAKKQAAPSASAAGVAQPTTKAASSLAQPAPLPNILTALRKKITATGKNVDVVEARVNEILAKDGLPGVLREFRNKTRNLDKYARAYATEKAGTPEQREQAKWDAMVDKGRHFGELAIPEELQTVIESGNLAQHERLALEGRLSDNSLRALESLRTIISPETGKPVSYEQINTYAKEAFQKLIDTNPEAMGEYTTLGDYLLNKKAANAEIFADTIGGEPIAEGGKNFFEIAEQLESLIAERDFYKPEIEDVAAKARTQGEQEGRSPEDVRRILDAALQETIDSAQSGPSNRPAEITPAEQRARLRGMMKRRSAEPTAQAEGVSYFQRGSAKTATAVQNDLSGKVISPFEWIKTAFTWFRTPFSVGKVHGNQEAAYQEFVKKVELGSMYAGSTIRASHELGHNLIKKYKFPEDPGDLVRAAGPDVVKGFVQFDYDPKRIFGVQSIREGFAEWFRQRITGEDQGTRSPEQMAAAAFGEKWLRDNGLTEIADRLLTLSDNYRGASPELRARLEVSPRGEQADATGLTKGEAARTQAESLIFQAQQNLDDNLKILTLAQKASGKTPAPGRDLRTVWSAVRVMGKSWADSFAGKGMQAAEIDQNGNWTFKRIGEGVDWIIRDLGFTDEDLKAEGTGKLRAVMRWMGMPVEQKASRLDTFMISLATLREIERGSQMLVDREKLKDKSSAEAKRLLEEGERLMNTVEPRQAELFRTWLNELKDKDPKFYRRGEEALRRVAVLNDNILTALESVGWYSKEDTTAMRTKYPGYIPMYRVVEGEEFKPNREMKRYGSGRMLVSPITALESRYAEASYIFAKQLKDNALLEAGAQQGGAKGIGGYFIETNDTPEVRRTDLKDILSALGIPDNMHDQVIDVMGVELLYAIQPKKWSDTAPNLYSIRSNGKKITLQIDNKALYNLLTDAQTDASPTATLANKVAAVWPLQALKKLVTWSATQANLVFPIRNPIRDPYHLAQNEGATVETLKAWAEGQKGSLSAAAAQLFGKEMPAFDTIYQDVTGQELREFGYTSKSAGARAFRAVRGESGIEKPIHALHKVQEFLELVGFAEQGPRRGTFYRVLAEMGYTRDQVEQAMESDPAKSPIPLHTLFYATQRAAESTTDFNRKGIWVKEYGKIAPFFSPHIAGMSQEIRNWEKARQEGFVGPKSKAMLGTLAVFVGFELLHWWTFKDDEWYKNLPEHLRYNWWIVAQTPDGGTIGIPKPQGLMRMAGAYLQELLRTGSNSNPRFAMATSSVADQATPRVLPIVASETLQVARNRDWRGMPIVPRRDEFSMDAWEQFRTHQLPYLLEQLTGGLASTRTLRLPHEAFISSRSEPNLPVAEYYDELQRLSGQRTQAQRLNRVFPQEARYQRLHSIERRMQELSREARGERLVGGRVVTGAVPSPERLRTIRREQVRLAALAAH